MSESETPTETVETIENGSAGELPEPASEPAKALNLSQVRAILKAEYEIEIGSDGLSDIVNAGNVSEQLRIGGNRARREVPPDVVPLLAGFIADYRLAKGRLPQVPMMLEAYLKHHRVEKDAGKNGTNGKKPGGKKRPPMQPLRRSSVPAARTEGGELVPARRPGDLATTTLAGETMTLAEDPFGVRQARQLIAPYLQAYMEGRGRGMAESEEVLNAEQACALLQITPRMLRKFCPPYRRFGSTPAGDRWRRSDLLLSDEELHLLGLVSGGRWHEIAQATGVAPEALAAVESGEPLPEPAITAKSDE